MATQAPAGGGAMMAMAQPTGAMMMPAMPTGAGGGGGGPAGPAYQGDASLGLFAADEHGLAEDELAIGIDLGGEWVRASVWDAGQKRALPLDLDGFGGPLRLTRTPTLTPNPQPNPHPNPNPDPNPSPDQAGRCERSWPSRGPRRPWWARRRSARRRRSTRSSAPSGCSGASTPTPRTPRGSTRVRVPGCTRARSWRGRRRRAACAWRPRTSGSPRACARGASRRAWWAAARTPRPRGTSSASMRRRRCAYISTASPLHLPCISPHLPCISPASPLYLTQVCHRLLAAVKARAQEAIGREVRRDVGEM